MHTNILIVDDHNLVREGIRSLLEKAPGMKISGEADNGRAAVTLASTLKPDVILMDISMPDMNGIDAIRKIKEHSPDMAIIALSMHSNRQFVVEALNAGACGYLLKDCASTELVNAIRSVADGLCYLSPQIAGVVINDYKKRPSTEVSPATAQLSAREREVLQLLAEGKNTKEIAFTLDVSPKTVETQRLQIMKKLNIHSIAELTKFAIREGITSV